MFANAAAMIASPIFKFGLLAFLAAGLFGAGVAFYNSVENRGKREGESQVIDKVQTETIRATTKAREEKEKANADVVATPFTTRVDQLP